MEDKLFEEKLILASGSPRRKEILTLADIEFEVIVSDVDESFTDDIPVDDIPEMLAVRKAQAIHKHTTVTNVTVLAADTIVAIGDEILGKPVDRNDAIRMIQKLSGKKHRVLTGVCILTNNEVITFKDITWVTFSEITNDEINYYVDRYKPFDKAGAYAIQEWIGVKYITKIEGCYYNVMGLPLPKIIQQLNI